MAGIFDRFFGGLKSEAGGKEKEICLEDAVNLINDKIEKKMSLFYPKYDKICLEILSLASSAKDAAEDLGKSSLDKGNLNYRIGTQMQKNFAERAPAVLASLKRPEKNYFSYLQFHVSTLEVIKNVAKITQDNRYLSFFFSDELGRFGKKMNEIAALADALSAALESEKSDAENIKTANELKQNIVLLNKQIISNVTSREEKAKRKKALEDNLASISESNKKKDANILSLRQSVELLNSRLAEEKKKVTDQLSPFQRQFRKMQKYISDKDLAKSLVDYIHEPEKAALEEVRQFRDYQYLRKILSELKKRLEKGEIENSEKIRFRRILAAEEILAGSILQPIKSAIELEDKLSEENHRLETELNSLVNTREMKEEISRLDQQIADLDENERRLKESLEEMFSNVEAIALQVSGNAIKIKRTAI